MKLDFQAWDYTSEDSFQLADYAFEGSTESGWEIFRNGEPYLKLGAGYKLLKTKTCGVCSTDLDRRFLPFPLPQVIGHELVAEDLDDVPNPKSYVVEINDTYEARGESPSDAFCEIGLPTHSPERRVLGIDRLPGGFGPYILAPVHAAIPFDGLDADIAVLTEPFAAALQAVISSVPPNGSEVAVLGPRRLGSLVLAALVALRASRSLDFKITAIVRHDHLVNLAKEIGADEVIDLRTTTVESLKSRFDILYDTTSTESGFISALKLAKKELHLKTTNGQVMCGLNHLTELVVDELSILPFSEQNLSFHWPKEKRQNKNIFVSETVSRQIIAKVPKEINVFQGSFEDAAIYLKNKGSSVNDFPRFDLALVSSPEEISRAIRPIVGSEESLVRPRGAILVDYSTASTFKGESKALLSFFKAGKSIRSSRCGDFHLALQLLKENPQVSQALKNHLISHRFPASELPNAYSLARNPNAIKVLIQHGN